MEKHDFDTFKQRLREWMDSHSGEYDAFVAGMNRRDDFGYQTVLSIAMGLAPEYEAIVNRRINRGPDGGDVSDIETLFTEKGLAEALTGNGLGGHLADVLPGEFPDIAKASLGPAMLSWLYFGQSFERMVERGEELRRNPEIPYHEKMLIVQMIQMLVDQSVELGLRTKVDWQKHHSLMKLADSEDALGVALTAGEQPDEKRKPGRPSTAGSLTEMFSPSVRNTKTLTEKIGEYLTTKHGQSDIARLKVALDELHYLVSPVDIKPFRDALAGHFSPGIHIVHERGIQDAYKRLMSFVTVNGIKVMIANRKEDRSDIDELAVYRIHRGKIYSLRCTEILPPIVLQRGKKGVFPNRNLPRKQRLNEGKFKRKRGLGVAVVSRPENQKSQRVENKLFGIFSTYPESVWVSQKLPKPL